MNRAEARIKSYQNSVSQLNSRKDMTLGNSGLLSFDSHSKSFEDELNLAKRTGRKKKRK